MAGQSVQGGWNAEDGPVCAQCTKTSEICFCSPLKVWKFLLRYSGVRVEFLEDHLELKDFRSFNFFWSQHPWRLPKSLNPLKWKLPRWNLEMGSDGLIDWALVSLPVWCSVATIGSPRQKCLPRKVICRTVGWGWFFPRSLGPDGFLVPRKSLVVEIWGGNSFFDRGWAQIFFGLQGLQKASWEKSPPHSAVSEFLMLVYRDHWINKIWGEIQTIVNFQAFPKVRYVRFLG